MAEVAIRPFRASDTPRLVATLERVFGEYGMRFDPSGYDRDVLAIEERYRAPDAVFYAAEVDGLAVGFAGADLPEPGTAELHRLYLDPAARGQGLGRRLVALVEAWARERGARTLELWSDVRFFHAHALYAGQGYALCGQRRLTDPDGSIEFGFRRSLDRPATPVVHDLAGAARIPLASLGTERLHWASMVAAAILDSRTLVRGGRVRAGGHELPHPAEVFGLAPGDAAIDVLELPGRIVAGFERVEGGRRERRAHPLFQPGPKN